MTTEPLTSPAQQVILEALKTHGPMTRPALAVATGQAIGCLGTRLALLSEAGLVQAGAEIVALPGQRVDDWLPDEAAEHEQRRRQWQEAGLITLALDEVPDGYLAQQLRVLAIGLYGQRRRGR